MQEPHTIRLYEDPDRVSTMDVGRYRPTDLKGWDHEVGYTLGLEDQFKQYVMGTITDIGQDIKEDGEGFRYKLATVTVED
jgi:hypothetical protein